MGLRKKVSLIIYRFREQGLEVFLTQPANEEGLSFVEGGGGLKEVEQDELITLDAVQEADGAVEEAVAVEADWHEIPSLKSMLVNDAVSIKEKLKEMDEGMFMSIKDALKTALPHQYAFLKELKEVLTDRNSIRNL